MRAAVDALKQGDNVVLSPAIDGGYTLIGLSNPQAHLFKDISWSTETVYAKTLERAAEIGVPVVSVPSWYDVDDEASFAMLQAELTGTKPPVLESGERAVAPATQQFLRRRQQVAEAP